MATRPSYHGTDGRRAEVILLDRESAGRLRRFDRDAPALPLTFSHELGKQWPGPLV